MGAGAEAYYADEATIGGEELVGSSSWSARWYSRSVAFQNGWSSVAVMTWPPLPSEIG
ncbi:hypothetical protein [Kribbella sp. CA-294648]|uniref:hypothetical protein n=1 Tax=Kribbella sp. CA-294648 TaxID=3239948 RepID=UPI003D8E3438